MLNSHKKCALAGTRTHDLALASLACYRWAREGQLLRYGNLSIHYIKPQLSRISDKWGLLTRWVASNRATLSVFLGLPTRWRRAAAETSNERGRGRWAAGRRRPAGGAGG